MPIVRIMKLLHKTLSLHSGISQIISKRTCQALSPSLWIILRQLFALDWVTFEADTRKINPALWTESAGNTDPFIVSRTAPHLATGPAVKNGEGERKNKDEEKERAHGPHTQLYLMFTYELEA